MPKISIVEKDLTTPGVVRDVSDVVFVPGFVNTNQDSLYKGTKYIGLAHMVPTLFTSVAEFEALCGSIAPIFVADQPLPEKFNAASHGTASVPMFKSGDVDPGYVMAKELLAAGLPVVFTRMNSNEDTVTSYSKITDETTLANLPTSVEYFFYTGVDYKSYKETYLVPDTSYSQGDAKNGFNIYKPIEVASAGEIIEVDALKRDNLFEKLFTFNADGTFVEKTYPVKTEAEAITADLTVEEGKVLMTLEQSVNRPLTWLDTFGEYYKVDTLTDGVPTAMTKYTAPTKANKLSYDPSNVYIQKQYSQISVDNMYEGMNTVFNVGSELSPTMDGIIDKGNYNIKYLTSGGYPVFEYDDNSIVTKMLGMAEARGDCVALIDHTDFDGRELNPLLEGSLYKAVEDAGESTFNNGGEYGAMFTPWRTYSRISSDKVVKENDVNKTLVVSTNTKFRAPASFAYLTSLADSIKTNANWLAIAGVTRGKVKNVAAGGITSVIPNKIADYMQPRVGMSVNAITNITPYGETIWGNRTLKKNGENLTATSFLNIRNLVSDVKKVCYRTARAITFEQDTEVLWINFKTEIAQLLDRMKSGYGISGYKIIRDTNHEYANEKATVCAQIILFPTYAVEDFYITVVLKDDEITVE